jgi:hypothetical protein
MIAPGSPWDLGHVDGDRSKHWGPEHRRCNRGAPSRAHRKFAAVPVDDPANGVFWGPKTLDGQHVRWSRAWFEWRESDAAL